MKHLSGALAALFISALANAAPYAYIANTGSNNVSVIDTAVDKVVATIPVGSDPTCVAVSRDGKKVYVTNVGSGTLSVIDGTTWNVVATVSVGVGPIAVAVDPFDHQVLVLNWASHDGTLIDAATNLVIGTVSFSNHVPTAVDYFLAPSSNYTAEEGHFVVGFADIKQSAQVWGATAYFDTNYNYGAAQVGSVATWQGLYLMTSGVNDVVSMWSYTSFGEPWPEAGISVGQQPSGIAITPNGDRVYVAVTGGNRVAMFNLSGAQNPSSATLTPVGSIPVGQWPKGIATTPSGNKVYVVDSLSDSVSVIDAASSTVVSTIGVGSLPSSTGRFIQAAHGFVPDPFAFAPVTLKPTLGKGVVNIASNSAVVTGVDQPTHVTVVCPQNDPYGCDVSIDGGGWVPYAENVAAGQSVRVRLAKAPAPGTSQVATVYIGGRSADFKVTTK